MSYRDSLGLPVQPLSRLVTRTTLLLSGTVLACASVALGAPRLNAEQNDRPATGRAASASNHEDASGRGEGRLWHPVAKESLVAPVDQPPIVIADYQTFGLDQSALVELLARAPVERAGDSGDGEVVMELPWPDGSFRRFRIEESPIMEPELAAQFPELRTYQGQGITDRTASLRFDWTPSGFHAMVLSGDGTVFIDPHTPGDALNYIVYYARDHRGPGAEPFHCGVTHEGAVVTPANPLQPPHGATLRRYLLAVAATGEYTARHGGTVAGAMNAITTTVNRVNLIFQKDLAVRLVLVANNASIIYTDPLTDGYTNGDALAMQCENPPKLDAAIGVANYDIGHVFATAGGGRAALGVVCSIAVSVR